MGRRTKGPIKKVMWCVNVEHPYSDGLLATKCMNRHILI